MKGQHIMVLHAFIKKSNNTPKSDLDLARKRQSEIKNESSKFKK